MTQKYVNFFVTGFGPFMGVDKNPTQSLVEFLGEAATFLVENEETPRVNILGTAVMRVGAEDVDAQLSQLLQAVLQRASVGLPVPSSSAAATAAPAPAPTPGPVPAAIIDGSRAAGASAATTTTSCSSPTSLSPIVLLHLGVANTATAFRLESRAYNCATFRVPDANGWSPQRQEVEPGRPGGLEGWVGSALPLEDMARALASKGHGDVVVSTDAGRFICNWCYYRSCRQILQLEQQFAATATISSAAAAAVAAQQSASSATATGISISSARTSRPAVRQQQRWHSLFIHVPPFSVYDEEAQRAFLIDAIREVAARVAEYDDADSQQRGSSSMHDDSRDTQLQQGQGGANTSDVAATAGTTAPSTRAAQEAVAVVAGMAGTAAGLDFSSRSEGGFSSTVNVPPLQRLKAAVLQGVGLPEPSSEQLLEQQQLLATSTSSGAAPLCRAIVEDASAGGGDGVGTGLGSVTWTAAPDS